MECEKVREVEGLKEGYGKTREITAHSGNEIGATVSTLRTDYELKSRQFEPLWGCVNTVLIRCDFWQLALHYMATVNQAVNGNCMYDQ